MKLGSNIAPTFINHVDIFQDWFTIEADLSSVAPQIPCDSVASTDGPIAAAEQT